MEGDPAQKAVLTRTLKIKGAYITVSPRSQPGINTVTRQKQKATQNFSRVVRSPLPEKQSSVPQDILPKKSAAFCSFCVFAGKTLFIWQIKVAKTAKAKLCATKNRHNYLKFCAFAKKNAVSLTNQGCKGCQNEALCRKARHRGSRGALAHKNSLLTKRREPKPTNPALAPKKPFLT